MGDKINNENQIEKQESEKNIFTGFWSERIFVVTEDYEIKGYVFMPKTGRKNRVLSDILNGKKRFVAIKDVEISCRKNPDRKVAVHNYIQLNIDSIVLIRPCVSE
jgi:hypothetical protein